MSDEPHRRSGRFGAVFVAFVVVGSAVGVIGWYVMTNRTGIVIDATGFDADKVTPSQRTMPVLTASAPAQPASGLDMMRGGEGIRVAGSASAPAPRASAPPGDKTAEAHASFTEEARKHEADVRNFSIKMEKKYPILHQYGKDWMSHPDLSKLSYAYRRNHDPVAFVVGLSKAPSLGAMVKQYAGNPAIIGYITEGIKQAPAELTASAMDVLSNDAVAKNLIANVASGLGLPPSVTGLISGGGDTSKIDQNKIVNDVLNSAAAQAPPGQQQAPPVPLPNQP